MRSKKDITRKTVIIQKRLKARKFCLGSTRICSRIRVAFRYGRPTVATATNRATAKMASVRNIHCVPQWKKKKLTLKAIGIIKKYPPRRRGIFYLSSGE